MCVCVCVHAYASAGVHVCVRAFVLSSRWVQPPPATCICLLHLRAETHMCVCVCIHAYASAGVHVCVRAFVLSSRWVQPPPATCICLLHLRAETHMCVCVCVCIHAYASAGVHVCVRAFVHENITELQLPQNVEPQFPGLRTALRPRYYSVTQCTGHISANARSHQLHRGDRECGYYMS